MEQEEVEEEEVVSVSSNGNNLLQFQLSMLTNTSG